MVHSSQKPFREPRKGGTCDPAPSREAAQASCVQRVVRQPAVSLNTQPTRPFSRVPLREMAQLAAEDGRRLAEPTWHAVGWADVVQSAATEGGWDWCDVVDELERAGLGVDQSQARHESHVSPSCANARFFVGPSVADAVSLIRTSSQKIRKPCHLAPGTSHHASSPPATAQAPSRLDRSNLAVVSVLS